MQSSLVNLRNIKSTLIVMYCGRSGSYLFSNLMDQHPEVLSCPPDSLEHIIERLIHVISRYQLHPQTFTPDHLIETVIKATPNLFNDADRKDLEGNIIQDSSVGVSKEAFKNFAKEILVSHLSMYNKSITACDIFVLIHWSYALSQGREISEVNPVICWQRHTIVTRERGPLYASNVINPIFITAVRRFEDALDSHLLVMKYEFDNKVDLFTTLVSQFIFNLSLKDIAVPQYAIKFEDMHINTEQIMLRLCDRLNIKFDPILLETTLDGKLYEFEKAPGQFVTGLNKDLTKKCSYDFLTDSDIVLLNLILQKDYIFYDYNLSDFFLEKMQLDPKSIISGTTILHLIKSTTIFKDSYLAKLMQDDKSIIFLPNIITQQAFKNQLDLIK